MGNTISRKEAIAAFEGTYTQLRFKMESYNGYHDYSEPIVRTANELVQLTYQADYIEALQNIPIEDFAGYYEMVKRLVNKLELAGKEYFNTHEVITATNLSGVLAETEKVERMVEILNELEPKDMVHLEYQEKRNAIQFIMTNWGVFDAEEQAIIKLLHALSAGDIPLFISDLLNNEGRLLRSLTTRIDGPEKTALFGWFDSMLKEQQSAPPLLIDENYEIGRGSLVDGRVSLNLLNLDNAETRTEIIHPFRYVEYKYHGENISVPAVSFVGEFGGDDDFLYDYKYKEGVDYTNLSDEEKDALFREFVIHYLPGGFLEQLGSPLQIIIGVILVIFLGGYLASFKVFLLALDIGSIAIEGYLGIQIIIKALEMKDTATSVRQLKLSAQYFAYGAAKLTMQVVNALLTFGDMVKTKKPDIEVDEIQSISRMNGVQEQTWNRSNTVGRNPSKSSATGREVIARMEREGRIITDEYGARFFQDSRGVLRPLEEEDMSHITDAVTWWNHTGRYYGAKSPEVRAWMLDSKNYVIDYYSYNRAAGPRIGETYLPPLK